MIKKCLIVGYGSIAQRHIEVVKSSLPDVIIAVYRDSRLNIANENVHQSLFSLAQIQAFEPDIAIIASPSPFHLPMANFLASLGVHLLIEKPISDKSQEAKEFFVRIFDKKIVVRVGYNLRFLPSLNFFKNKILDGLIGDVWSVDCQVAQHLSSWRPSKDYRNTVSAKKYLGGGVLLELSHEIDYLAWIFGTCSWVSAWVGKKSDLEIDVEDSARLIMGFSQSGGEQIIVGLNMNFFRKDKIRSCTVVGSKGTLVWDAISDTVTYLSGSGHAEDCLFLGVANIHQTYVDQFDAFLKSIARCDYTKESVSEAMNVAAIIEASKRSSDVHNCGKCFVLGG